MTVQLELWHVLSLGVTIIGGYWAVAKLLASQAKSSLDLRFAAVTEGLGRIERARSDDRSELNQLHRDFMEFKVHLPLHYVQREDYVRGQSVIEAKLDSLAVKLENVQLRSALNSKGEGP